MDAVPKDTKRIQVKGYHTKGTSRYLFCTCINVSGTILQKHEGKETVSYDNVLVDCVAIVTYLTKLDYVFHMTLKPSDETCNLPVPIRCNLEMATPTKILEGGETLFARTLDRSSFADMLQNVMMMNTPESDALLTDIPEQDFDVLKTSEDTESVNSWKKDGNHHQSLGKRKSPPDAKLVEVTPVVSDIFV